MPHFEHVSHEELCSLVTPAQNYDERTFFLFTLATLRTPRTAQLRYPINTLSPGPLGRSI